MSDASKSQAGASSPAPASSAPDGFYWLESHAGNSSCLVKLYTNPDTNERGVGFGIWDGGGFLPLADIVDDSRLTCVAFAPNAAG